ncbi:hypothetical protein BCR33DRAFT_736162 [Rhizoclosmatium globosum]|uniref:Beta-lactamase-related domain-containing protein n=1 Tax=Rhizoclosmatium globosum TaxID=329046 RepID=A0A1Y2CK52_9FUNG|nr:hypothetical protein BCR33DRAFT_736162 [Rhizoclosmatium globosum]|eukprot:ORY47337.1 hypothetical protein BCR33DRAFT_736162 [Rhizoclosmatium globosum]
MADRDLRGPPDRRLLGFDDHVRSSLSDFKCDGASLCVVAGGKTVFAKGFGSTVSATDPQNQKPLDADSVFSVGGGALLGLVAVAFANVLDWNANLKIDGIRDDATLADLMTHRIGLEADSLLATLLADLPAGAVASALKLSKNSKNFRGSSEYSPLTTPIAAHLLSQSAQRPFETLLHDLVFAKIGASHASCFVSQGRKTR